jgi:hypothetical protein
LIRERGSKLGSRFEQEDELEVEQQDKQAGEQQEDDRLAGCEPQGGGAAVLSATVCRCCAGTACDGVLRQVAPALPAAARGARDGAQRGMSTAVRCALPACGKELPGDTALLCGHCMRAAYCGKECQRQHWKAAVEPHKAECQAAAVAAGASNNSAMEHELGAPQTRDAVGFVVGEDLHETAAEDAAAKFLSDQPVGGGGAAGGAKKKKKKKAKKKAKKPGAGGAGATMAEDVCPPKAKMTNWRDDPLFNEATCKRMLGVPVFRKGLEKAGLAKNATAAQLHFHLHRGLLDPRFSEVESVNEALGQRWKR